MATGDVGIAIFEKCPIVGAYYIAVVPHSALLNILAEHYGDPGWMDDAERLITRHINPLREHAAGLVRDHRFVIKDLMNFPGLVKANAEKIAEMKKRAEAHSRTGIEGGETGLTRHDASRNLLADTRDE